MADQIKEDEETPVRTEEESSDSGSGTDSEEEEDEEEQVEWMVTARQKRSTAGNRLTSLIQQEEPDDELELLFAEADDDAGFEDVEGDSDVQMDSSDDDDDQGPAAGADDLEGEKELQRQAKAEKAKKRKLNDGIPKTFKKKVKIDPTAAETSASRPKKKSERASWIPTSEEAPTRASQRGTTRQSKEQLHVQMADREVKRLKQLANMEKAAAAKEAAKKPALTQADRLAEAARIEKANSKSLSRWEEAEQQREEEQKAKLAALSNRHLEGPVITWWSGIGEWVGGTLKKVGKTLIVEPPKLPTKKRKAAEMEADSEATPAEPLKEGASAPDQPTNVPPVKEEIKQPLDNHIPPTLPGPDSVPPKMDIQKPAAVPLSASTQNTQIPPVPEPANITSVPPTASAQEPETPPVLESANTASALPTINGTPPRTSTQEPQTPPVLEPANTASALPTINSTPPPTSTQEPQTPPVLEPASTASAPPIINGPPPSASTQEPQTPPTVEPPNKTPGLPTSQAPPAPLSPLTPQHTTVPSTPKPPPHPPFILAPPQPYHYQPPPALDGSAPLPGLGFNPPLPQLPRLIPSQSTPFAFGHPPYQVPPPPQPEIPKPPAIEHATKNYLILSNFEETLIKQKDVQTQILFNRKFPKATKPKPTTLCAITGYPAKYRDPITGLAYCNVYAYKEIQRLKRAEYKWSALVGAYVGPGTYVARGVPPRFVDPLAPKPQPVTPVGVQQAAGP